MHICITNHKIIPMFTLRTAYCEFKKKINKKTIQQIMFICACKFIAHEVVNLKKIANVHLFI